MSVHSAPCLSAQPSGPLEPVARRWSTVGQKGSIVCTEQSQPLTASKPTEFREWTIEHQYCALQKSCGDLMNSNYMVSPKRRWFINRFFYLNESILLPIPILKCMKLKHLLGASSHSILSKSEVFHTRKLLRLLRCNTKNELWGSSLNYLFWSF